MQKTRTYRGAELQLAETFPPGDFIREELQARGWTQSQFAQILGRPGQFVSGLINAKRMITPRSARELASAFGTSAELWLNLEMTWQLSLVPAPDPEIAHRAKRASAA
jgi:HTH-type transcriptional regulator/antitoxin HigA